MEHVKLPNKEFLFISFHLFSSPKQATRCKYVIHSSKFQPPMIGLLIRLVLGGVVFLAKVTSILH
jgi:hypothetical protein